MASDFLITICRLASVNVCAIIILSLGNTQINILYLYFFVELIITIKESVLFKTSEQSWHIHTLAFSITDKQTHIIAGREENRHRKTYGRC